MKELCETNKKVITFSIHKYNLDYNNLDYNVIGDFMAKEMINKYVKGENGYYMEKVEFIIKDVKRKVVKFNGVKFEVKPYINSKDLIDIASIVYANYYKEGKNITETSRLLSSPIVDSAFLLGAISTLTNIAVPKDDMLDYFVDCGLADFIKQNIVNYDACLKSVYYAIEQKNNYDRFEEMKDRLDEVMFGVQDSIEKVTNIQGEDIKGLQEVVKEYKELVNGKEGSNKDTKNKGLENGQGKDNTGKLDIQKIEDIGTSVEIVEQGGILESKESKQPKDKNKVKTNKTNKKK